MFRYTVGKINLGWFELHAVDHCTNSCNYCNNHSPYHQKKEHTAEEYFPWIDKIIQKKLHSIQLAESHFCIATFLNLSQI